MNENEQLIEWLRERMDKDDVAYVEKERLSLETLVETHAKDFAKKSQRIGVFFLLAVDALLLWLFHRFFDSSLGGVLFVLFFANMISWMALKRHDQKSFTQSSLGRDYLLFYISRDLQKRRGVWYNRKVVE